MTPSKKTINIFVVGEFLKDVLDVRWLSVERI